MNNHITYIGMDAHKKSIQVAFLLPEESVPTQWEIPNEPRAIKRMAKKLLKEAPGEVRCCYEAGPCGYALQRALKKHHVGCIVIAPTLTPRKPGDRIKTDRKDAKALATLYRAGLLTEVHPPTEKDEAVRDLCRCREDAGEDLKRHRHQMTKFLLRRAYIYPGKTHWTHLHRRWLLSLRFEDPVDQKIFNDYLLAIEQADERLLTLNTNLSELAEEEPYRDPVAWLRCFRGIDTVSAMTTVAELHDFRRFHSPRQLMAYLGLVPSEHSSSDRERRGKITKAGNKHVRRILVEAAWHYQHRPTISVPLRRRREGQPGWVIAVAEKAQRRLHRRYWRLVLSGKPRSKAVVAITRELVGFIWATLYLGDQSYWESKEALKAAKV